MILLFESANFDEAVFGDPEHFRIDRYPNNHMAFGFGTISASAISWRDWSCP
jgi:cytochrome P450 family 142 subfamily A polypeptide 1